MIGIGFDIHRLARNRKLVIGGVRIKYDKGLLGHSDADVLLHALIDAILGAAKAGDIGDMFPDTDPAYKDISSAELLKRALKSVGRRKPKEVDSIIFAQAPKLGRHKKAIGRNIARLLGIRPGLVNVKAKTMEGLGPIGGKNAIAALVLVVI
ncbi:MAG: 2-C-methyl-D-erythritol 2,4-cyclodiphosphate synthase [Candidatus Brocadiia bacterium]